ncbi:MAG: hypothetical protein V4592_14770 [Bacteroidota bacterium]
MSYISEFFKGMGFVVDTVPDQLDTPFVDVYRIQNETPPIFAFFRWRSAENNQPFFQSIQRQLKSILRKGIKFDKEPYDYDRLKQFVETFYPRLLPEEKLDSVLEYVDGLSSYEGEAIILKIPDDNRANEFYFTGAAEWLFYLDTAIGLKLIHSTADFKPAGEPTRYNLTIEGLSRLLKLKEKKDSRYCFVASAFNDEMDGVFADAIAPALRQCGFEPYRVKDETIAADVTINDAILSGIKKSRFTIADFTYNRPGVYFEAGFALGRGQQVIYLCKNTDMEHLHFDTNHYQHLVWSDAEDLKKQLIDRIGAYID